MSIVILLSLNLFLIAIFMVIIRMKMKLIIILLLNLLTIIQKSIINCGPKAAFWQKAGEGRRYRRVAVRVSAMRCSARTGK